MKSIRFIICTFLLTLPLLLKAQALVDDDAIGQNVRLAWAIDADGGVGNDAFSGFEVAYASEIFPLDQMYISYTYTTPYDTSSSRVVIGIEEFYPIAETFKFYGTAGLGYMWTDLDEGTGGDNTTGWVGKLGAGFIIDLCHSVDLYSEIAYYASDRNMWFDGENTVTSTNWGALLGLRFKY